MMHTGVSSLAATTGDVSKKHFQFQCHLKEQLLAVERLPARSAPLLGEESLCAFKISRFEGIMREQ